MKSGTIVLRVKYASIERVGFSILSHTFKMAAMTSFNAEKCCYLLSEHEASARLLCSSVLVGDKCCRFLPLDALRDALGAERRIAIR